MYAVTCAGVYLLILSSPHIQHGIPIHNKLYCVWLTTTTTIVCGNKPISTFSSVDAAPPHTLLYIMCMRIFSAPHQQSTVNAGADINLV